MNKVIQPACRARKLAWQTGTLPEEDTYIFHVVTGVEIA